MSSLSADLDPTRCVLRLQGPDNLHFLQGLVTNDVERISSGPVYAAMLTPQGKYIADFLMLADGDAVLMDVDKSVAAGLMQRLAMYKLRADVQISETSLSVIRGLGDPPQGAVFDPRHSKLGWRLYGLDLPQYTPASIDWTALYVAHAIPTTGLELATNDSYILEYGFERLNGVDFRKGCYVGQEVTARMHHKTTLKKGLCRVKINGASKPGTQITADGKPVGTLHSVSNGYALAYLRFDRATGDMQAGTATVSVIT